MNTQHQSGDAVLQKPITITVDTPAKNRLQKLLVKLKLREEKKVFHVKPLVLGSLIRVSQALLSIDQSLLTKEALEDKNNFLNVSFELMQKHSKSMAEIVAVAVTNEEKEPSKSLVKFFLYNLTAIELMQVFSVVIQQMNVSDFISSIISVRGLNVIEKTGMNPQTQGS